MAPTMTKPAGVLFEHDWDGEHPTEWYVYPAIWEDDSYPEIGIIRGRWTCDLDADPLGCFDTAAEAQTFIETLARPAAEVSDD